MSWFTNLKPELAKLLHRSEADAHTLVTALEQDLGPVAADFVKKVETAATVDVEALAAKLAPLLLPELERLLGAKAAAPAEPTAPAAPAQG